MFKKIVEYFRHRKFRKQMDMLNWQYGEGVKAALFQDGIYDEFFKLRLDDKIYSEACELFLSSCFIKRIKSDYARDVLYKSVKLYKTGRHSAIALLLDEPRADNHA